MEFGYGLYSVTFTLNVLEGAALSDTTGWETVIVAVPPPIIFSLVPPETT